MSMYWQGMTSVGLAHVGFDHKWLIKLFFLYFLDGQRPGRAARDAVCGRREYAGTGELTWTDRQTHRQTDHLLQTRCPLHDRSFSKALNL